MYEKIISRENIFRAWQEFKTGKIKKEDVSSFAVDVEEHLFALHDRLASGTWRHGAYRGFYVRDPKLRRIHKATVVDRVLHHALVRVLEPVFDTGFIFDSYASRRTKGTDKAIRRFRKFAWQLSRNNTKTVWVLQCDIKKFFDSIDHMVLLELLKKKIHDAHVLELLWEIINSYSTAPGKGIPIGNVTSQLFSNVYLNPFDHFVKRQLRVKNYIRYADDFVILSRDKSYLVALIPLVDAYLKRQLTLQLHPRKVLILPWHGGADFLGFIHFLHHAVIRTKTKQRMIRKVREQRQKLQQESISSYSFNQTVQSYLGRLKQCRSKVLQKMILKM